LTVNGGTVRLATNSAGGLGRFTVNSGATLVVGAAHTNSITLSGGTLGNSMGGDFLMGTNSELTATAATVSLLWCTDPQTPTASRNIQVDGTLRGSGTLVVQNADNIINVDN